ncbi:MAG: hypothetical protein GY854_16750 [Deltaproteobacteria bacterium]|nr:hypothetical protein [Deltaproteobacteria bacterium]
MSMSKLASVIVRLLHGRKLNVAVLHRGNPSVAESIAGEGHRVVIAGDRFRSLYKLYRKFDIRSETRPVITEAKLDALPIRVRSLDALVLTSGLPSLGSPVHVLGDLRDLLRESGLLIWPHPVRDGTRGKLGRLVVPGRRAMLPPMKRHELSALTMQAGFSEVSQVAVPGGLVPWIVTTGRVGIRPWKIANKKNFIPS